jgi:beta-hydroxylase
MIFLILLCVVLAIVAATYVDGYSVARILNQLFATEKGACFFDTDAEWCKMLRDAHGDIEREFLAYQEQTRNIPVFGDVAPEQEELSNNQLAKWRVAVLRMFDRDTSLCAHFPVTMRLLSAVPHCSLAMFSILEPGKTIAPHEGVYKGVLRYHLGLITPAKHEDCKLVIGGNAYSWQTGEDVLFDDTYEHWVQNATDETRVVLFLNVKRDFESAWLNALNWCVLKLSRYSWTTRDIVKRVDAVGA